MSETGKLCVKILVACAVMFLLTKAVFAVEQEVHGSRVTCGTDIEMQGFLAEHFPPKGDVLFAGRNKVGTQVLIYETVTGGWVELKKRDGRTCIYDIGEATEATAS